jgi:hypothetical protein
MVALAIAALGLAKWHGDWLPVALFGILAGAGFGLYYGTVPNMIVDTVPRDQQAISAGLMAAFGSVGSSFAIAIMTAILVRYPFEVVANTPGGKTLVNTVPQVYTKTGYGYAYLFVGLVGSAIAIVLALALRAGRTPLQGGALE